MPAQSLPPTVPPPPALELEGHQSPRRAPRAAYDPEPLDTAPQDCPICRGRGWTAGGWECGSCDGFGTIYVQQTVECDWCADDVAVELAEVQDWAGRRDSICPACWQAAQADPAGHGDVVLVAELAEVA